jgi:ABC-2 type transport system permease protein
MLNYIKAELYRNFNRMYLWAFTGVIAALALFIIVISKVNNIPNMTLTTLVQVSTYVLSFPVFFVAAMLDIVVAEEHKNQTMRNVVTFGVSRSKLILSKVIVSVILAFISALIIAVVFYGSGAVFLGLGSDFPGTILEDALRILAAVPLWIGAISVGTFLATVINNNTIFAFAYGGLFLMTSKIIQILEMLVSGKFKYVRDILITTQLSRLGATELASKDMLHAVLVGVIYTIVFTILSMVYFKKKEVK